MWRRWLPIRRILRCWVHCGPSSLSWFKDREGVYVGLRLLILVILAGVAPLCSVCYWISMIGAGVFAIDILLFNTAVVFETGGLEDPLRSLVLTMVAYASLAVAFAPGWIAFRFDSGAGARTWDQLSTGIYQSVRALTTTGPEGALYPWERLFASFETLVGIYFLAIILAGYVSWLNDGRAP